MKHINIQQAQNGLVHCKPANILFMMVITATLTSTVTGASLFAATRVLKACLLITMAAILMMSISGCSILLATPPAAHVQIDGLNSQLGEFIVVLNPMSDQQMDIPISDRYALRVDFKWLWNQGSDNSELYYQDPDDSGSLLTPWLTCKYRF
jgi:hypothetical protein